MKFTVVTSCYNAEKYIAQTINSVINQTVVLNKDVELQYLICDAGSGDDTVAIINKMRHPDISVCSEPDLGMYDGLSKGLRKATGDIVCYINAGDLFYPSAFSVVNKVFASYERINFLTGMKSVMNEHGEFFAIANPFKYRKYLLIRGAYGTRLPVVQQESTFWRRSLLSDAIMSKLANFKLAGDLYLWSEFIKRDRLYIVNSELGCFRYHKGQLSENLAGYRDEAKSFLLPENILSRGIAMYDHFFWRAPLTIKKLMNSGEIIRYDRNQDKWVI